MVQRWSGRGLLVGSLVLTLLMAGCSRGGSTAATKAFGTAEGAARVPSEPGSEAVALPDPRKQGPDPFELGLDFGERLKAAQVRDMTVVMTVNGEPVTQSELIRMRVALQVQSEQLGHPGPTEQEVRERVIRLAAMRAEARRRGLYPTDAEVVEQVIAPIERLIAKGGGDNRILVGMVEGLGLTQADYWRQPWVLSEQRQGLIAQRLASAVGPLLHPDPGETTADALRTWWDLLAATAVVREMPPSTADF